MLLLLLRRRHQRLANNDDNATICADQNDNDDDNYDNDSESSWEFILQEERSIPGKLSRENGISVEKYEVLSSKATRWNQLRRTG